MQERLSRTTRTAAAAALVAAIGFGLTAGTALADEAAMKYRQNTMKALGGHMASVAALVKGQVDAKDHLPGHADAIAAIGKMGDGLFLPGSDIGETAALPEIWSKPDEFAKAVTAFEQASAKFAEVAGSGDAQAVTAAFGELGKSCGGCHQLYRKKM